MFLNSPTGASCWGTVKNDSRLTEPLNLPGGGIGCWDRVTRVSRALRGRKCVVWTQPGARREAPWTRFPQPIPLLRTQTTDSSVSERLLPHHYKECPRRRSGTCSLAGLGSPPVWGDGLAAPPASPQSLPSQQGGRGERKRGQTYSTQSVWWGPRLLP